MQISVKSDADAVRKKLAGLGKRIPYTISDAVNSLAFETQKQLKQDLPKYVDQPTPYTVRAIQVQKGNIQTLTAIVGFAGGGFGRLRSPGIEPSEYMGRLTRGGIRTPASGRSALLVPASKQKLNRYGNLTRANRKVGKRADGKSFFVASQRDPKTRHLAPGLYKRVGKNKDPQALVLFKDRAQYRKQFDFQDVGSRIARRLAPAEFDRQIQRTLDRMMRGR